jgi:Fe2+ transport system protein B
MSDWTVDTLKEHIESLRTDDKEAIAAALAAAEKAVDKADEADQKHFETINERNREIDKLTNTFLATNIYDVQHKSLEDKIDNLQTFQNKLLGVIVFVGFVLPIVVGIVVYILTRHSIPTG